MNPRDQRHGLSCGARVLLTLEHLCCLLPLCLCGSFGRRSILCFQIDSDLSNRAAERKGHGVAGVDGRARVFANVEGFDVQRVTDTYGVLEPSSRRLLPIDRQHASGAFANTTSVILEVEHHRMVSRRERLLAVNGVVLDEAKRVVKSRSAFEEIERPPIGEAAQCGDHSFCAGLRNVDISSQAPRSILRIRRRGFRNAPLALIVGKRGAVPGEAGTVFRISARDLVVVQRKHVVFGGFR